MNLKTYQAYSMGDVLTRIRKDLGEHAVVLHTRTFRRGGVLGLGARTVYEVTAADSRYLPPDVKIEAVDRQAVRDARTSKQKEEKHTTASTAGAATMSATKSLLSATPQAVTGAPAKKKSRQQQGSTTASQTSASPARSASPSPGMSPAELLASLVEAGAKPNASRRSSVSPSNGSSNTGPARNADTSPAKGEPIPRTTPPALMKSLTNPGRSTTQPAHTRHPTPDDIDRPARIDALRQRSTGTKVARRFIIDPETGRAVPAPEAPKNAPAPSSRFESRANEAFPTITQPTQPKPNADASPQPVTSPQPWPTPIKSEEVAADPVETIPAEALADTIVDRKRDGHTGSDLGSMRAELEALRGMVQQVLESQKTGQIPIEPVADPAAVTNDSTTADRSEAHPEEPTNLHATLAAQYTALIENEVAEELATQICKEVQEELAPDELDADDTVRERVLNHLIEHIPVADETILDRTRTTDGRPLTMALVGPTGVGKTTTIAKLAAAFKLRDGLNVGLITTDTYRIAAVDQLRTYANIIGVPLKVAITPSEIAAACLALRNVDVILIDTAGRSPNDTARIEEIHSFLDAARPHESHLVLSSASSERVLLRTIDRFSSVPTESVIFTKLDEAVNFGVIVNVMQKVGKRLSFITTGQEVPDQIERGEPRRLARLILGESLRDDAGRPG